MWSVGCGEVDLREYDIARAQFFNAASITSGCFTTRNARFSGECIRKLGCAEYIELLIHPTEKLLAVHECSYDHRNAIHWARLIDDKALTRQFGGSAYLSTLYDIFAWNPDWGYRLRGAVRNIGGESVAFFDARESEVLIPRSAIESDYLDVCDEGYYVVAQSKYRITAMPTAWQQHFGSSYYQETARSAGICKAGLGTELEHNTEPDINPTAGKIVFDTIDRLITKFSDMEDRDGTV